MRGVVLAAIAAGQCVNLQPTEYCDLHSVSANCNPYLNSWWALEQCSATCDVKYAEFDYTGCTGEVPCSCYYGGSCPAGDGVCVCTAGYTGASCETDVNECGADRIDAADCGPGTCNDLVDGYSCTCPAAHTGDNCEVSVTVTSTGCACFEDPTVFTCACCADSACQCGGIASDTCALCTDTETCAQTVREKQLNDPNAVDEDILTSSGCPCFFDNTKDCACCKPGRCQCDGSATTFNYASVDLSDKCVPCSGDCNEQWIDRSLDGQWVVNYPEPTEGAYGEMVWTVSGSVIEAHYLSGLLPGRDDTVFVGTIAKVDGTSNKYTVTGIHQNDEYNNVPSETVTVSADGLTINVVGACSGGAVTSCATATPGICCTVTGQEGDGSFRLAPTGNPCWWDPSDDSCAKCSEGGCGCGGPQVEETAKDETEKKDTCVPCSKWWRCDPQLLPELVQTRETFRCAAGHFGENCGATNDAADARGSNQQGLTVVEEYLDYTLSSNGCPWHESSGIDGACCRKGGCQCGNRPLEYVSPNLCVSCDASDQCQYENEIATWKLGEWTDCNQPCVGFAYSDESDQIVGSQTRVVRCSDQWGNALDESRCTAETRADYFSSLDGVWRTDQTQFPTKDNDDWEGKDFKYWFGGPKPIEDKQCNTHDCIDYTCYKTANQRLVSIEAYGKNPVYEAITTDENTADDTCPTFTDTCHFDLTRSDCARCLPGGCQCSYEPVKHKCVSCDVGGSACIGAIPDADPFFQWESGPWGGCDKICTFEGDVGLQHRVVTCKGEDGGSYADHRCDPATFPPRTQECNTQSCADEYTETLTGCTCWFDLSDTTCGCCKPGKDGSAGCQITTPENPDLVGCDHCPNAPPQTPNPTPAPTPLPTPEPTFAPQTPGSALIPTTPTSTTTEASQTCTLTHADHYGSGGHRYLLFSTGQASLGECYAAALLDAECDMTSGQVSFRDPQTSGEESCCWCPQLSTGFESFAATWPGELFDVHTCAGGRRLEGAMQQVAAEVAPRSLAGVEEEEECMQCVSGLAPELSNCNPGNAARYLGHAECCRVWSTALDTCDDHCLVSTKTRKLATCDKLVTGEKDEDSCDVCLEAAVSGSSTGSDCGVWKNLLPQCAGPCTEDHKGYAHCKAEKEEEEVAAVEASPEACRRCVFARSAEVADCLPDSQGNVFAAKSQSGCCQSWAGWLESCKAECPAPAVGDSCDVSAVVDANLVADFGGWSAAATCQQCVQRQSGGQDCVSAPTQKCCSTWEMEWSSACQFQCGSAGLKETRQLLCGAGQEGAGETSVAPVVALLGLLVA